MPKERLQYSKKIIEQYQDQEFILVTDMAPIKPITSAIKALVPLMVLLTLYQVYFNYLKPHSSFNNNAPLVVECSRGQPINSGAQLIRWINKSDK